ncbi:DeoR/GlpR family DNA-binding transcription regulator [Terrilactibacillus laevilacticus]|nr:DeoR/GlpR family DNA-binding transcription regulator [Terrilactibacillus laevilacticus]
MVIGEVIWVLTPSRRHLILSLINEKNLVSIRELAEWTQCSEATIRRDLSYLEKENKLKRFHGGAQSILSPNVETSLGARRVRNVEQKKAIAEFAANLVEPGDCIFLDAGTTVVNMVEFLRHNIIVVTNGLSIIEQCVDIGIPTYSIGGRIKTLTSAFVGKGALDGLAHYHFDKCFMGMNGIDTTYGFTTPDPDEGLIKQKVMSLSDVCYVLADQSKFDQVTFSSVNPLNKAVIITNNRKNSKKLLKYQQITRIEAVEI